MANDKQAIVKLDTDGSLISCAKGSNTADCGYVPGAKICAKCGALAVQAKEYEELAMDDEEMTNEELNSEKQMVMPKRKPMVATAQMSDEDEDEEKMYETMPKKKKKPGMHMMPDGTMMADDDMPKAVQDMEEEDEEEEDEEMMDAPVTALVEDDDDEEEEEEETVDLEEEKMMRKKMRARRLASLGFKAEDFEEDPFICAFDRKVYPSGHEVCASCPGGCVSESGMPSLLEVEGMVEDAINGKVLDSGYSERIDTFVLDVERKDGKGVEVFVDGSSGEIVGWHKLEMDAVQFKQANEGRVVIGFTDAADIAVKSVQGEVVAVEPDIFEGFDAYAVEIDGIDGKSYDVFVDLQGTVLGYDEYTHEEASEIEAEAAEIALKRAYSDDERADMSKKGYAMSDGSYPIKDESDLRNAVMAVGRAKDPVAAKMHCMKRAKELGRKELIPQNWAMEKSAETTLDAEEGNFLSSLMEFEILSADLDEDGSKTN